MVKFPKPKREPRKKKRRVIKQNSLGRLYSARATVFRQKHPKCWVCKHRNTTEVHHAALRSTSELLLNEDLWIPICRKCHRWAHHNRNKARENDVIIDDRHQAWAVVRESNYLFGVGVSYPIVRPVPWGVQCVVKTSGDIDKLVKSYEDKHGDRIEVHIETIKS